MRKLPLVNPGGSTAESIGGVKTTWGSEPSQYPQEKKTTVIPGVAASDTGRAQTVYVQACRRCVGGVVGATSRICLSGTELQTGLLIERSGTIGHSG